jgi:hypothetical protein
MQVVCRRAIPDRLARPTHAQSDRPVRQLERDPDMPPPRRSVARTHKLARCRRVTTRYVGQVRCLVRNSLCILPNDPVGARLQPLSPKLPRR